MPNLWPAINSVFLAIEIQYRLNAAHDSQQVRQLSAKFVTAPETERLEKI